MPSRSSFVIRFKTAAALVVALVLFGCAALQPTRSTPQESAVVTGIASGRASVAGEKSYVLRTANGRVYFVSQVLRKPVKEGDSVELELAPNGAARIREK
jgi:hypothetical protein